jgi:cobalamin biosynthesis protein CobT
VPPITAKQLKLLITQAIHEPGHQLRAESLRLLEEARLPKGHPIGALWNIVEDECMERVVQAQWRGDRKGLVEGHVVLCEATAESWAQGKAEGKMPGENSIKSMASYIMAIRSRRDWDYCAEANEDLIRRQVPDQVNELADALISEGWADRIAKGGDEHEAKQIAYDLFERLYPGQKAEDQEQQKGSGQGQSGSDEGEPSEDTDTAGGEGSEFDDTEGTDPATGKKTLVIKWADIVQSHHENTKGSPSEIDWTGKDMSSGVAFYTDEHIQIKDYTRSDAVRNPYGGGGIADKQFANQVRRLIQAENRVKRVNELKSGKLDKRNMIRVLLPTREGGEWNRRVFSDTEDTRSLNTAVCILTDWSGSMTGDKMRTACHASQRLLDTFDRALHVPCEVLAFTADYGRVILGIIKSFGDRAVTSNDIGGRLYSFENYSSGNADGDSVLFATKRLLKRNETRKVLIVLSDGSPSVSLGDASSTLVAAVNEARRLGIEVHGIGIESNAVQHFYGEDAHVIKKVSELNAALLGTLEKVVRNGR